MGPPLCGRIHRSRRDVGALAERPHGRLASRPSVRRTPGRTSMPNLDIAHETGALGAAFALHAGPFTGRDLTVRMFRGREQISRLFSFDVVVATSADGSSIEPALLGQPATLLMEVPHRPPRVVRGIV